MNKQFRFAHLITRAAWSYVWLALAFPSVAMAYVDPGSGSVIVTTILGLIAAVGYTFRKFFYRLKRMISGKKSVESEQQD